MMRRLALGVVMAAAVACRGDGQPAGALPEARAAQPAIDQSRRTAITQAVERVAPAVVTVQTETVERAPVDPFLQLFGAVPRERVLPGLGSGFIVHPDGIIVTNAHVVAGAERVQVALRDGTTYDARILGLDELNDLAVLKVDARDLPVAPLGNSDSLLVGEWTVAIGNPFGFVLGNTEPSVTAGVLSGTGRNLIAPAEGGAVNVDMLQTDAAINPGNSGGPLVNASGEVIGVNSSIFSPTGSSVGLGFAIPINRVRRVVDDLLAHGRVRRPWVGVKLAQPQDPRDALRAGAVVQTVVPGSPAARAGLRPGDVILRSRQRTIRSPFDWEAELLSLRVGERVPLLVRRGGQELSTEVAVADLPEVTAPKVEVLRELQLITLTPALRAQYDIRSPRGALIYDVSPRVAAELGVAPGDVIVQVNRMPVSGADDVARALDTLAGRGVVRLFLERRGRIYSTDFIIR